MTYDIDTLSIYTAAKDILKTELRRYAKENSLVDREDTWFDWEAEYLAEQIANKASIYAWNKFQITKGPK